jgi:uncharacterized RDD family membrane protein YckC
LEIEDRIRLETPEGVDLALQLAGVGSRFASAMLDHLVQLAGLVGLAVLFGSMGSPLASASFAVTAFALIFGYDVAFETLAAGRTPGKRVSGLRVVRVTGEPVTFLVAVVRNLMRLIDFLPAVYLAGITSILVTQRNQRLGDLAAGTLVVRERHGRHDRPAPAAVVGEPLPEVAVWDTTGISAEEFALVAEFLGRQATLPPDVRGRLAAQLAGRLRPRCAGPDADVADIVFLEQLIALREHRRDQGA